MITDALLAPLVALANWLSDTLPDGTPLGLPSIAPVRSALAGLNSLLPVSELLTAAMGLMSAVVVFLVVRLVLLVRQTLLP